MRIARGSGRQVAEVMEMLNELNEYKQRAKILSQTKEVKNLKKGGMSSLSRNMNAQNMSKVLPQMMNMCGLRSSMMQMGSAPLTT